MTCDQDIFFNRHLLKLNSKKNNLNKKETETVTGNDFKMTKSGNKLTLRTQTRALSSCSLVSCFYSICLGGDTKENRMICLPTTVHPAKIMDLQQKTTINTMHNVRIPPIINTAFLVGQFLLESSVVTVSCFEKVSWFDLPLPEKQEEM